MPNLSWCWLLHYVFRMTQCFFETSGSLVPNPLNAQFPNPVDNGLHILNANLFEGWNVPSGYPLICPLKQCHYILYAQCPSMSFILLHYFGSFEVDIFA